VLLWLVIYLQDVLGYSAQDAGLRLAVISGAQLVTAVVAGRVSERVPARWLIRSKDFVRTGRTQPPGASPVAASTGADSTNPARSA
jgi:Na+/melibiose symporter-like transporter